jgi:hypothetical protein
LPDTLSRRLVRVLERCGRVFAYRRYIDELAAELEEIG